VKTTLSILLMLVLSALCAPAMGRLDALSEIESRNNDLAIGSQHEVSRYQILPVFWTQAWGQNKPRGTYRNPTNPAAARMVVNWIMQPRCRAFEARYRRAPDDFEFYILWHRPACYIGLLVPRRISAAEADRGRRFAFLCQTRMELASAQ